MIASTCCNRNSISARQSLKSNADGSARSLYPGGLTRGRQGIELAAGAREQVHPDAAVVLAEREETLDHRWKLVSSAREEGREQLIADQAKPAVEISRRRPHDLMAIAALNAVAGTAK